MARVKDDPVTGYAKAVVAGEIVAGRLVRLACQRHLDDLANGPARGLRWDVDEARHALDFFTTLRIAGPDGEEIPFELFGYLMFIIGSLVGWQGADGFRRFRTSYCEVGKGNAKSPAAAALGLYCMIADGELEAEVYSAATTREQAGICFRDARNMGERLCAASPQMASALTVGEHNIAFGPKRSFFRPVSSEHRGLDGKRPHCVLVDELQEHPTSIVVDKMRAGTKGRRQALIFEITNSGHDRTTVCWQHREYSIRVLEGNWQDDSWFAYVCQLDPCAKCRDEGKTTPTDGCPDCDQWDDESVWLKVNPYLGRSVTLKYLREQVNEAKGNPAKEGIVKRLNFCIWTQAAVHAIPMDRWDSCKRAIDREALKGRECYAGLDIGAVSDFTAFALLFPHDDTEEVEVPLDPANPNGDKKTIQRRSFTLLPWFWLPASPVKRDAHMANVLDGWRRQKLIRTTPGDTVDYDQVLEEILAIGIDYPFRFIAVDRGFQGGQMCNNLMKHFGEAVVECPQGIISMNAPFREFIELVINGRMHHDGNPVLRWMVSNCAAETRGGLIKPSKEHSKEKIDIVTAAVMGLREAMLHPEEISWFKPEMMRR